MAASHEDRNAQLSPGVAIKAPCRAATTAAITLSGEQTIDAVACVSGDRVLVKNQTAQTANGIYLVSTGAWTREPDFDGTRDVVLGTFVFITNGAVNAGAFYECTTTGTIVFGTSNITFAQGALGPIALPLNLSNTTFTQSGTGATARTGLDKTRDIVSVKDFGALGDGVTDDHAAEQAVINAGPNIEILFPPAVYLQGTTTLTITKNQTGLRGGSPALRGNVTDAGPVLKYTGTGTALLVGSNPDVDATFLTETQIQNLRLKVANSTAIALRAWMLNGARLKNVHVYGSSGAGVGLQVEGCIDTTLDTIDIQGFDGAGGVPANYLNTGVKVLSGFGGAVVTTTRFRDCYLHYCLQGAYAVADAVTAWESCVFEANTTGFLANTNSVARLSGCWFEANLTTDVYFGTATTVIVENSPSINSGTRQTYFDGNVPKLVVIRNCRFASSHVAPRFFNPAGSSFLGTRFVLDNNILPAGFTFGALNSTWRNVEVVGMRLVTYRFRQTGVAANTAYNMPQDNADVNAYQMPDKGHILGSYTYYVTQNITAGTYTTGVKKNGGAVATFTSGANAATPSQVDGQYYTDKFVKGDTLQATVTTSIGFLAINGAFITEVIVAFGDDGM